MIMIMMNNDSDNNDNVRAPWLVHRPPAHLAGLAIRKS